jgi:hypothetical protein
MCFMNVREVEFWKITGQCRRKIEMSPGVQSRDDTRVPGGHEEERLGLHLGRGVEQRI